MSDHYYTAKPTSQLRPKEFSTIIFSYRMNFITGSGVFSIGKLDLGTKLLINSAEIKNEEGFDVLDLGCGYGAVGIALKKENPNVNMVCTDVNIRAVNLTRDNADKNKVKIKSFTSDIYKKMRELRFDAILVNLPQNAGKEICFKMIEGAKEFLKPNGTLQTVSRHQKGGKSYEKKMIEVFGNCEYLGKGSGYRVYCSRMSK